MDVPCKPFGNIHDYVPFYFATVNPMLLSVLNKKNIDQPHVVFLALSVNKILEDNVIFTDASANTFEAPNFYSNPKDLNNLKWNLIDKKKWSRGTDEELHARMAEVLIHEKVPVEWIDTYIVYNSICKKKLVALFDKSNYKRPQITYQPFNNKYFYFTKFYMKGRKKETLITGPSFLKSYLLNAIYEINEFRKTEDIKNPSFENIEDAISQIRDNFCVLQELQGIYQLKTSNTVHCECVSDHTSSVVRILIESSYYQKSSKRDKLILELSAYLHDIGKGPHSKWKDEIQPAYADHPADAVPMIIRILCEEFEEISNYEIEKICLLVFYHDLIGDILFNGRSKTELINLDIDEIELEMLISISSADISAINSIWNFSFNQKIEELRQKIIKEL